MRKSTRVVKVQVLKNNTNVADECTVAESFLTRLRGLIGRTHMPVGHAMLFPKCNSIHMWFMRMAIDVVFLRKENAVNEYSVASVHEGVRPWRVLPLFNLRATDTLELPVGSASVLSAGDRVCIV